MITLSVTTTGAGRVKVLPFGRNYAADPEPKALVRNFDVAGKGWMPRLQQSSLNHCLMVLGMAESNRLAWLRGGEALQRILLEATRLDYVVSLASQVVEVPPTRDRLRKELDLEFHPLPWCEPAKPLQRRPRSDAIPTRSFRRLETDLAA